MSTHVSGFRRDGHLSTLGVDLLATGSGDAVVQAALLAHVTACPVCQTCLSDTLAWARTIEPPLPPGLARDGHATAVGLERLAVEPHALDLHWLGQHVEACLVCRRRLDGVRPPQSLPSAPVNVGTYARPWRRLAVGLAVAASLAVAVGIPRQEEQAVIAESGMRPRGGPVDLEVFAHDGTATRRVSTGDQVHVGERLGFRLWLREPGFVLIAGADATGHAYLCAPYSESGDAQALEATSEAVTLDDAVELDDVGDVERLVLLRCSAAFSFARVAARLGDVARVTPTAEPLPALLPGCDQHETILLKSPRSVDATDEAP